MFVKRPGEEVRQDVANKVESSVGNEAVSRQRRVKLTLSMTASDRRALERLANEEGVTMATLVHMWIAEHTR